MCKGRWILVLMENITFLQENDLLRDIFDLGPQVKSSEVEKTTRYQRVSVKIQCIYAA